MNKHSYRYLPSAYVTGRVWFSIGKSGVIAFISCIIFPILQFTNFLQQMLMTGIVGAAKLTHVGKSHTDVSLWWLIRENTREHCASTVSWLFELAEFSPVISCSTAQACVINTLHSYSVLLFLLFFSHFQFLFVSFFRVYATSWKHGGVLLQLNTQLEHTSGGVGEKYPQHFLASPACSWAKERRRSIQEERNFRSGSWVLICSQVIGHRLTTVTYTVSQTKIP